MPLGLRRDVEVPPNPVLIIALEGWIDAGFAGATAANTLVEAVSPSTLVTFDGEELIDLRARRPRLRIDNGVRGPLGWQEPRLVVGRDANGTGLALLLGPEPDFRWKAFASEVIGFARSLGTELVVSLGAFPAPTPHTRPVRLASVSVDRELVQRVGFVPGSVEIPASGADAVLAEASAQRMQAIGLWARMPHYLAGTPYPEAAVVLLEGLSSLSGLHLDISGLRDQARETTRRVDQLIAASEEHTEMVRRLEAEPDAAGSPLDDELPSGDEIAAELERYLRGELS